ncbi:helix-turn-helix domain-containing protein [Microbispora cellulosiformans]|uniref:Helix-turn-helix domain-containing protein n=1 Tax=Microbispora cellulosiformans TaxID=2614688 RepID=A0A5J5K6P9_9ACTN|nr:helix-turn-helix transcriptional regulator [Microbispora cellulosiformans]KAA9379176.1 helix-turn-helix domain-containing protein [Microbispora cellulosiformans]
MAAVLAGSGWPADGNPGQSGSGPAVLRITLGTQLRRLREAKGISRSEAGHLIRGSESKISRLELGRSPFKERDVADLLTLYGVTDAEERAAFLDLVKQANNPGWWHKYSDVLSPWLNAYLGLEAGASVIRSYESQAVPALLQTEDYARAYMRLAHPDASAWEINRRVEVRRERQRILTAAEKPTLWTVIDEAAVRRPIGGPEVLRGQLRHLIEMGQRTNVSVQVLPYDAAAHALVGPPFTMLRFAEPDLPDLVYLEQLNSALYLDKREDVDLYTRVMETLCVEARPGRESVDLLRELHDLL